MSCIRFNTPAQRAQLKAMAPAMLSPEQAAALHHAPEVTPSKIARLRLLAIDPDPKIREAVAASRHAPPDVMTALSADRDAGVRGWVARNEATPCDILRSMVDDPNETVRGWLAVNFFVPADVMALLADDPSETVRGLARWKSQLAAAE